jgi:hypothetical protein
MVTLLSIYRQVNIIRKISVGPDYMKSMNYTVGQEVLDKSYSIYQIIRNEDGVKLYIIKDDEITLWKEFSNTVPVSIEFNINF